MSFPKVEQPSRLNIPLFNHQLTSIYNMEKLENEPYVIDRFQRKVKTKIGIFGDIPGYGKSLSVVGLVLRDKMKVDATYQETKFYYHGSNMYSIEEVSNPNPTINCTMLVAGPSIIGQWEKYFSHCPLRTKTILTNKSIEELEVENYDVILVVPSMYNKLHYKYQGKVWKRFIYDEPTSVHIPNMCFCNAKFYWFVTATYESLCRRFITGNSYHMLRTIFGGSYYSIDESFLVFLVKNPTDYVISSFRMPETLYHRYQCYNPQIVEVLQDCITQETAERISAGDIKGAISSLGGDSYKGSIIDLVTQKLRTDIQKYQTNLAEKVPKYTGARKIEKEQKYKSKISELSRKLNGITERFQKMVDDNDCPICADKMNSPVMVPCCQNMFCGQCLLGWLQSHKTCPYCRATIKLKELIYISNSSEESDDENGKEEEKEKEEKLGKPQMVVKLLTEIFSDPEKRVILFSSYDATFTIIKGFLKESNINYAEIKGSAKHRQTLLEKYESGEVRVIFLNSKYNGAGINLQNTTDIIIYHEMGNDIKKQIVGRALRIGRRYDLHIHEMYEQSNATYRNPFNFISPGSSSAGSSSAGSSSGHSDFYSSFYQPYSQSALQNILEQEVSD